MAEFSYCTMDVRQLEQLRRKIRNAEEPDNPALIQQWIGMESAPCGSPSEHRRRICISQFNLLLEVIADDCLPVHWRNACLDNINRPLYTLQHLADDYQSEAKVRHLFYELRVISHYFQNALSHSGPR